MEQAIRYYKQRSLTACIADGWRITALGWKKLLKDTWIYAALFGLSTAFVLIQLTTILSRHVLPALRLQAEKADERLVSLIATPDALTACCFFLSLVLFIFSYYLYKGRAFTTIGYYKRHDRHCGLMPATLLQSDRRMILGLISVDGPLFLLSLLALSAALYSLTTPLGTGLSVSLTVVSVVLLIVIASWGRIARIERTVNRLPLLAALKTGFRKSLGTSFILLLLTALPLSLFVAVCLLPAAIYFLASLANADSVLVGDSSGMPGYLTFVFFLLTALGFTLSALAAELPAWALALKHSQANKR